MYMKVNSNNKITVPVSGIAKKFCAISGEIGGIGVAAADQPEGPYKDLLGKPLINDIVNGAQPIDQFVFKDVDGQMYMYYGGWGHCNIVKMSEDLTRIVPFPDGQYYKEVTPQDYVEGPFMFIRNGIYYFMWSEGGWGLANYRVAYAMSTSPFGPFERLATILEQDEDVATGAGHHSLIKVPDEDKYFIVYHRRPLGNDGRDSRVTCVDEINFNDDGTIIPVKMTFEGVVAPYINHTCINNSSQCICGNELLRRLLLVILCLTIYLT